MNTSADAAERLLDKVRGFAAGLEPDERELFAALVGLEALQQQVDLGVFAVIGAGIAGSTMWRVSRPHGNHGACPTTWRRCCASTTCTSWGSEPLAAWCSRCGSSLQQLLLHQRPTKTGTCSVQHHLRVPVADPERGGHLLGTEPKMHHQRQRSSIAR